MSGEESEPTTEEIEFLEHELNLMIKQYRLEDFGDSLAISVELLNRMLDRGLIEENRAGIMQGMNIIVKNFPKIDNSFRRFALALMAKLRDEVKQMQKPN